MTLFAYLYDLEICTVQLLISSQSLLDLNVAQNEYFRIVSYKNTENSELHVVLFYKLPIIDTKYF